MPELTLHAVPPSHPCAAAAAAIRLKGLEFERIDLEIPHSEAMASIYGEGRTTVPGMVIDGEPVHGTRAIMVRLDALRPDPPLFPSSEVREAEQWADEELQPLGRRLPWGALHFRPEYTSTFGAGGTVLDPAGTTSGSGSRARHGATTASPRRAWPRTSPASRRSSITLTS